MTSKELKHLKSLRRIFEIAESSHDYSLSDAEMDYFGYLILKDELRKTNKIIKEYESLEKYEAAHELLQSVNTLKEHIKEIEEDNNFDKIKI